MFQFQFSSTFALVCSQIIWITVVNGQGLTRYQEIDHVGGYVGISVTSGTVSWQQADTYCFQNYRTHLASIHNSINNTHAFQAAGATSSWTWIGLNDQDTEGAYVWSDGSSVDYTNWNSGEPNQSGGEEDCTNMWQSGYWNDLPCESTSVLHFICNAKQPTRSPTTIPSADPSGAPSDSPTNIPSTSPTSPPSDIPSQSPTKSPTKSPSTTPSVAPSVVPSSSPVAIWINENASEQISVTNIFATLNDNGEGGYPIDLRGTFVNYPSHLNDAMIADRYNVSINCTIDTEDGTVATCPENLIVWYNETHLFLNATQIDIDVEYVFSIVIVDSQSGDEYENIEQGELIVEVKHSILSQCLPGHGVTFVSFLTLEKNKPNNNKNNTK